MKTTKTTKSGQDGLSPTASAWVAAVRAKYELCEHHELLLELAARCWDRTEAARQVVEREGMTFVDRFGSPHLRPEAILEQRGRLDFERLCRGLGLDLEGDGDAARPYARTGRKEY